MFKQAIIFVALACQVIPTFAKDKVNPYEGLYESERGQQLSANITHLKGNRYSAALSTTVAMTDKLNGCGGSLKGELTIDDHRGTLAIPSQDFDKRKAISTQNQQFCKVKFKFYDQYKLDVEEVSGCSAYHGASCSFDGTLIHDASGI